MKTYECSVVSQRRWIIRLLAGWAILFFGCMSVAAQNVGVLPEPAALDLKTTGTVRAIVRTTDGKIIIGGDFTEVNGQARINIARLNADGTLDASWNPGANSSVYALLLDGTGSLYVGGDFSVIGGVHCSNLAKMAVASGTVDTNFNLLLDGLVFALAKDTAGRLYFSGYFQSGVGSRRLRRLNMSTGAVDAAWSPNATFPPYTLAIGGGWVYAGGEGGLNTGLPSYGLLARYSVSGTGAVDGNWLPAPDGSVRSLVADATHLYVAGGFTHIGKAARNGLMRIALSNTIGAPDPAWIPASNAAAYAVDVDATGVYVYGQFDSIGAQSRRRLAKLSLSDASAVPNWNPDAAPPALACTFLCGTVLATGDGGAMFGGDLTLVGGVLHPGVVRVLANGSADAGFAPRPLKLGNVLSTLALSDGGFLVGGNFLYVGATARPFLLRLAADRSFDANWSADIDGSVSFASELVGTSFPAVIAGEFERVDSLPLTHVARLALDSTADATWNPEVDSATNYSRVRALYRDGSSLFIGGTFDSVDGVQRKNLAKLDLASGDPDATWAAHTDGAVNSIVGDNAGSIYVGGLFKSVEGMTRWGLAKVGTSSAGVVDPDWAPEARDPSVYRLLFDPVGNHVYVAGGFYRLGGNSLIEQLGRVSATGTGAVDAQWIPVLTGPFVLSLYLDPSGWLYFGGDFSVVGGAPTSNLARVNLRGPASTIADPTWHFDLELPTYIYYVTVRSISPINGGGVLAGGYFTSVDGLPRGGIVAVGTQFDAIFDDGFE
jgi:Domain of unknown function (DUF5122) beta-propeller